MDFIELFETVEAEFSKHIATLVITAISINLTEKIKKKDLIKDGNFTKRLNKKTKNLLWEESPDTVDLVIEIRDALNEFQTRRSMNGIGGCKIMTLKEIVLINRR
jgi:hypothetical protein